ncbi:MAG: serine/threonine protein kinase [Hyalangium sp.]|uniref:serine/threonine protein kinase n=1 Tax=Hyalangium sp. TaxID=2028555 RepID=UPI00389A05EF
MTTDAFHPDHLKPGDMVGPWQIVESLGTGNSGHTFKVSREGSFFTMKMAVRPAPELPKATPEETLEERQVDGRMCHEGAILLANTSHPGLPHVREVGRWPHPIKGYLYIITDHVLGQPFHEWRERTRPTVAQFVGVFIEVVRVVKRLHAKGIFIRDFKSEHVIIPEDHQPVLVDLGSAWLPGGSTLTVGLAPGTPYALPPECVAFIREGSWKQGARFDPGQAGDLYQLGVFLYEALAECWPFNPKLPKDELLVAIETVVPRPPHRINPEVPEALSRITMKLLEKRPEDRYESAEALLQALWDANKERSTKAWKVRLGLPPEGPAPVTQDEVEERRVLQQESERRAQEAKKEKEEELSREQAFEQASALIHQMATELDAADEKAAQRKKRWRRIALVVGPLLLSLALFAAWWAWRSPGDSTAHAASEKGSPLMSTLSNSRPVRAVAAWLCATFAIGCPATQVRPPERGSCPQAVVASMEEMELLHHGVYEIVLDIAQPGDRDMEGVYHDGPIVSRVERSNETRHPLPEGTLLYGQLWSEGLTKDGQEAVMGRYTEALLPDGRRVPICFILNDLTSLIIKRPGSKPGAAVLSRKSIALAVRQWP